jgi:uncharacterized protein YjbI with pentapeptide repeats
MFQSNSGQIFGRNELRSSDSPRNSWFEEWIQNPRHLPPSVRETKAHWGRVKTKQRSLSRSSNSETSQAPLKHQNKSIFQRRRQSSQIFDAMATLNQIQLFNSTLISKTIHKSKLTKCTLIHITLHKSSVITSVLRNCSVYDSIIHTSKLYNCKIYGNQVMVKCEMDKCELLPAQPTLSTLPVCYLSVADFSFVETYPPNPSTFSSCLLYTFWVINLYNILLKVKVANWISSRRKFERWYLSFHCLALGQETPKLACCSPRPERALLPSFRYISKDEPVLLIE